VLFCRWFIATRCGEDREVRHSPVPTRVRATQRSPSQRRRCLPALSSSASAPVRRWCRHAGLGCAEGGGVHRSAQGIRGPRSHPLSAPAAAHALNPASQIIGWADKLTILRS